MVTLLHRELRLTFFFFFTWQEFLQKLYQLLLPESQLSGSRASGLVEVPCER